MKKLSRILITLMLVAVALFGVVGCNANTQSDLQSKIDELQGQIEELNDRIAEMEDEFERKSDLLKDNLKSGFYSLKNAYDMGLLTRDDLMSIAYYHNGGRRYNEEIMPEDYSPQPKTPEVLSENTELKIKETAAKEFREKYNVEYAKAEGFTITEYYGTYGGYVAVVIKDNYTGGVWSPIPETYPLAGVEFQIRSENFIRLWR